MALGVKQRQPKSVDEVMTVTLEISMESYSETVLRRTAKFSSKGVTVVTTLQDINGNDSFMDKLMEHIKWLEADS